MIKALPGLLLAFVLLDIAFVLAAEQPVVKELETTQEIPFELDRILVSRPTGLTYDQEVVLRIIRQGYQKKRSKKDADRDVMVCWLGRFHPSSRMNFLYCARNGDMRAQRLRSRLPDDTHLEGWDGYGNIQMTTFPVKRRWLEEKLTALPGSNEFDIEFISMRLAGERPPLNIPDDDELDRFAPVWYAIGKLDASGNPTENQAIIIDEAGFSVVRYRHISKLIEVYQSIESEVRDIYSKRPDTFSK